MQTNPDGIAQFYTEAVEAQVNRMPPTVADTIKRCIGLEVIQNVARLTWYEASAYVHALPRPAMLAMGHYAAKEIDQFLQEGIKYADLCD
ncbi:MAG: hypothetical protein NT120_00745 [Candidatus Aenigmarchaeota archaeon]|nr:hypothetical protein [Candidatus Aenigmarchaeota archaeon]